MNTIPVKYSETVYQPDIIKNSLIEKEVYLKALVYDGLRSMEVRIDDNHTIPAFALHFSGITINGEVIGLSYVFSIRNHEEVETKFGLDKLYNFYEHALIDNIILLSDECKVCEYISASNIFKAKKGSEYPVYFYADSQGQLHKIYFTHKQSLLVDYIRTYFNNGMVPAREYNSSILEIPDNIRNKDVEITTDTVIDVLGIYYESIDKKTSLYRSLFTISGINGLFVIDLIGKPAVKSKLKKKKVYTDFEKMFEELVVDKFEDNTYVLDIGHTCTHSYKKTIKGTIIEKKVFIYADKINNITDTFTFYKGQFESIVEDIVRQISENITEGLITL